MMVPKGYRVGIGIVCIAIFVLTVVGRSLMMNTAPWWIIALVVPFCVYVILHLLTALFLMWRLLHDDTVPWERHRW